MLWTIERRLWNGWSKQKNNLTVHFVDLDQMIMIIKILWMWLLWFPDSLGPSVPAIGNGIQKMLPNSLLSPRTQAPIWKAEERILEDPNPLCNTDVTLLSMGTASSSPTLSLEQHFNSIGVSPTVRLITCEVCDYFKDGPYWWIRAGLADPDSAHQSKAWSKWSKAFWFLKEITSSGLFFMDYFFPWKRYGHFFFLFLGK